MNDNTLLTLDDAVQEVLGLLTGLDLEYRPEQDRYRAITRQLNRALRSVSMEKEWSYYSDVRTIGTAVAGERSITFSSNIRVRQINDDAARLINEDGVPVEWAYFLPRDALHKYAGRNGLWCAQTRNRLDFSRRFNSREDGLEIEAPIMREPEMFRLPEQPEDLNADPVLVPDEIRQQEVDFQYPDLIVLRAAFYYAQSDPVMQPRVQTIEAQYKDFMYQVVERDDRMTDSPYQNEFFVPVQGDIATGPGANYWGRHPHADERY